MAIYQHFWFINARLTATRTCLRRNWLNNKYSIWNQKRSKCSQRWTNLNCRWIKWLSKIQPWLCKYRTARHRTVIKICLRRLHPTKSQNQKCRMKRQRKCICWRKSMQNNRFIFMNVGVVKTHWWCYTKRNVPAAEHTTTTLIRRWRLPLNSMMQWWKIYKSTRKQYHSSSWLKSRRIIMGPWSMTASR